MWRRAVALTTTLSLLTACSLPPAPTTPSVASDRPLNVGVGTDIPGLAVLNADTHERLGFDVDLYRWLAHNTSPEFTPVEVDVTIADRVNAIAQGRVQLVVSVFSITDERRGKIAFAGPYLLSKQGFMVRSDFDQPIRTLDDLTGRTVCTQSGSTSYNQLTTGALRNRVTTTTEIGTRQCVERLLRNQVDVASTDEIVLRGFALQNPALKVLDLTFGAQERYGVGLPKNDRALCERMSEGIKGFITNGAWDQFFRANFGDLAPSGYKPDPFRLDPCT
ncbi:MAG: transporter substrate-binding domain-containing protein [Saccharothrix sp.]|nr:transporter substrate-binding domain-containing protein [Saccharothrix sp.]